MSINLASRVPAAQIMDVARQNLRCCEWESLRDELLNAKSVAANSRNPLEKSAIESG